MPNSFRGFDFEWEETLVGAVRLKVERTVQTWRSRPEQNVDADGQGTGAGETRRTKTTGKAERGRVKLNGNRRRIQKPNGSINETNRANELKTQNEPSERPKTWFLVLNIIVVMLNYGIFSVETSRFGLFNQLSQSVVIGVTIPVFKSSFVLRSQICPPSILRIDLR